MKKILLSLLSFSLFTITIRAQNVGVGETSPANKLAVKGNLSVGSGYSTTVAPANGAIIQGNVGIGTASPVSNLDVYNNTAHSALVANFFGPNNTTASDLTFIRVGVSASLYNSAELRFGYMGNSSTANYVTLGFYGNGNGLSVTAANNVGVNTTTPAYPLDVTGVVNASTGFKVAGGTPTTATYLKGNGTNFVAGSILAADLPSLSGTYVDLTTAQTAAGIKTWSSNAIFNGNVGIGAPSPTNKLEVAGNTKTTNLQMTSGAAASTYLAGDGSGNGTWTATSSITAAVSASIAAETSRATAAEATLTTSINNEVTRASAAEAILTTNLSTEATTRAAAVNTLTTNLSNEITARIAAIGAGTTNYLSKYTSGSTLGVSQVFDNGTNVGIGTATPGQKLEVAGTTKTTNLQMTSGATNTYVMQSDATGNGTWVNPSALAVSNIYSADGSLSGNRTMTMGANNLTLNSTTGNLIYNPSSTGKMAVGTATPLGTSILTVSGTTGDPMYLKSTATESDIAYQNAANGNWQVGTNDAGNGTSGNQFYIYDANAATYNMTMQRGGNVGVATTAPLAKMDLNGGLLVRGTNTNTPTTPISAVEFATGRQQNGTMLAGQTTADIALQYGGGGYRHFIMSRHFSSVGSNQNAIDFYLNNSNTTGGSSAPGTGNVNMMSLTATGVGINSNNAPAALLEIKGSDWSAAGLGTVMITNTSATVGTTLRFNGPSHVYDLIGSTGASAGVGAGCFAVWDNTASAYRMSITPTGSVTVNNLAGSGYRTVYADANGALTTVTTNTASTNNSSASILDNTCTGQPAPAITVSGQPTSIATNSISVTVNLTHTWDADLTIFLVAPNGAILLLADRVGGSGDNFTNTVFSDGAATAIASGSPPFTGAFRPSGTTTTYCSTTGTVTSFGTIGGGTINPNGTWTLKIFDNSAGDVGTFLNWSISFGTPGGPRTVQFLDTRSGCPGTWAANTDMFGGTITLAKNATTFITGSCIRDASGRKDLYLMIDGVLSAQIITNTGGTTDWLSGNVTWSGILAAGTHTVYLRAADANVWGCGTAWGRIDAMINDQ